MRDHVDGTKGHIESIQENRQAGALKGEKIRLEENNAEFERKEMAAVDNRRDYLIIKEGNNKIMTICVAGCFRFL